MLKICLLACVLFFFQSVVFYTPGNTINHIELLFITASEKMKVLNLPECLASTQVDLSCLENFTVQLRLGVVLHTWSDIQINQVCERRLISHILNYASDGKLLSSDVTHYMIPDWKVVQDYLEILEFPELKGIIFMQTACQAVQHQRGRRYLLFIYLFIERIFFPLQKRSLGGRGGGNSLFLSERTF